jgi:Ca-activated chloride channel homolog
MKILQVTALLTTIAMIGCEESAPNTSSSLSKSKLSIEVPKELTYAQRGIDQSWPGAPLEQINIEKNSGLKNYYLIFDGSGSMDELACGESSRKIDVAQRAVTTFINNMPNDVNLGLMVFDNNGASERSKLALINKEHLINIVQSVRAGSGTPLGASMDMAYKELTKQAQKQQGYGEYNMIVITDGQANDGKVMSDVVANVVRNSPVNIHTIGFCLDKNHALNQPGIVNYRSANNANEIVSSLKAVLAESDSFTTTSFEG